MLRTFAQGQAQGFLEKKRAGQEVKRPAGGGVGGEENTERGNQEKKREFCSSAGGPFSPAIAPLESSAGWSPFSGSLWPSHCFCQELR
ncbi:hypothetical protein NL676_003715 [Syzygium grande]|nr:hypothetical protein NL676_003715 [Syzygium grande]